MDAYLLGPDDHGHMLNALRELLADGRAHAVEDLCAEAIKRGLVPPTTKPKYFYHAVDTVVDRAQLRGEKAEFVVLLDGRIRLNVPIDPFAAHKDPAAQSVQLDEFINHLQATANRRIPQGKDDPQDIGLPFERDVAAALNLLGLLAQQKGGLGHPDVIARAPLGRRGFAVVFECKTLDPDTARSVNHPFAAEAARMRDQVAADYAILIGPEFAGEVQLDDELEKHQVALWDVPSLVALLRAAAMRPLALTELPRLLANGRRQSDIEQFCFDHLHGEYQRAHVTLQYALEEGWRYQVSLVTQDPSAERKSARLTIEALALLVNERLAREGDLARVNEDDVRQALAYASHSLQNSAIVESDGSVIITRAVPPA